METYDYVVIGGGIVGFSTAYHLGESFPGRAGPACLRRNRRPPSIRPAGTPESSIPASTTSREASRPGSPNPARVSMVAFCEEHGIPHDVCGKVIVATKESELPLLENLYQRGLQNECPVEKVSAERVREIEPHVNCVAGVLVKSTGITSYVEVCRKFLELIEAAGGEVKFGQAVRKIQDRGERENHFETECR